ncbi:glycosyltransferase family 2 protein [Demequina sp. NBRC 110057]|uniref:glycosyltransferase family 2 protein n=1 Tax=Demequina sp. NBRC 110057 TaxID=1570346 RepID=UPI0009FE891C|nr:glycosyltransferase family 2 protein [Demequina sp. NBRC 110057]
MSSPEIGVGGAMPAATPDTSARADEATPHENPLDVLAMAPEHEVTADAPAPPRRRRRQWGAERPRPPLPAIEPAASTAATWLGGFAIVATVVMFAAYLAITIVSQILDEGFMGSAFVWQAIAYVIVMGFLIFSTFSYLLARQGALYRSREHVRTPRAEIDAFFAVSRPTLTALVPSYAEDPSVVRATALSAALQEYPGMRVVVLLDDPPHPSEPAAAASLDACRAVPGEIQDLLAVPHARFVESLEAHEAAALEDGASSPDAVRSLGRDFRWAAQWLREQQEGYVRANNADDFVADEVLGGLADDMETTAQALFASLDAGAALPAARLSQLCRRLVWTFEAQVSSFERKAYANLPHDANKAMNLNAYLGLMGHRVRRVETRSGPMLRITDTEDGLLVPDSDYVLTLDADSVILREYCLRLVHHLEMPGNERIAVIQTPYSAFRGATTRLERIAAATTDIQHMLHQGLTHFDATFWVGANAVIRKSALNDIVEVSYVGGQEVRRYVQDRTVIEDTESSIDLVAHGWSLYNYPERLSYSATPPDFGALAVQRARWANGGLLIAPKFRRLVRARKKEGNRIRRSSIILRVNYMASISWASFGLVLLLTYPFDDRLLSPIIVAAALPYFLAMSHDFHRMGYKRTDVFRVYAFNLILLAVNLGGTLKSLQQAAAKSKISFARTPKVANRTAAPALYVIAAYAIALWSFYSLANDIRLENWYHATFAAFNGVLTTYAIGAFIGFRNSIVDMVLGAVHWVQVPRKPRPSTEERTAADAWESVLYFGPDHDPTSDTPPPVAVSTTTRPRYGDTRARQRD